MGVLDDIDKFLAGGTGQKAVRLATLAYAAVKAILAQFGGDHTTAEHAALVKALDEIARVLAVIEAGLDRFAPGDIDKAAEDLARFTAQLAANDKTADEALDKKFDPGDNNG